MKRYSILILVFLITTIIQAQQTIKPLEEYLNDPYGADVYYKDVNGTLDKYIGTWKYDDGTHYFEITFSKVEAALEAPNNPDIPTRYDYLKTAFIYKHNGVEIYNHSENATYPYDYIKGDNVSSNNELSLRYTEPSPNGLRGNFANVAVVYSENGLNAPTITWTRYDLPVHTILYADGNGDYPVITPFVIPENMLLTKQ